MQFKTVYFQGETIELSYPAGTEAKCYAVYGDSSLNLTKDEGTWHGRIPTKDLSGSYPIRVFKESEDGAVECIQASNFGVAPGRSAHRDRADAIQAALDAWAKNPNAQITVGEITISYKNVAELRGEYQTELAKAQAEEQGRFLTGGPFVIRSRY